MAAGTYRLHKSPSGQFHWDLRSGNNEPILSSETYQSKQGALNGIQSCRENSPNDARYTRAKSTDNKWYFTLKAVNGEKIGTSEMYNSEAARENGIAACKRDGPGATLKDQT